MQFGITSVGIYSPFTYKCHKSNIKNLLMKSSEIVFTFLSAFHLIIWLMTYPKNFEKISILKIWQLGCWNSLQWEITLICHWNIHSWKQKLFFVYVMVPKNDWNIIYIKIHVMSVRLSFFLTHFPWTNLIAKYIYGFLWTRQRYSNHFKVNW